VQLDTIRSGRHNSNRSSPHCQHTATVTNAQRGRSCSSSSATMINYTERLTLLMQDIVTRVEALSFIDMADVLVFARQGRTHAEGAFATCHCLTLPPSEPGYYFWRDR